MKLAVQLLFFFSMSFALSGCTQNTQSLIDSFDLAFLGPESMTISKSTVDELPYASIMVTHGNNPPALMVLAWAEESSLLSPSNSPALKYLSANHEMIVIASGRIIKTVNLLEQNLSSIHSLQSDPLALGLHHASTPHHWEYDISWRPGYYLRYTAQSRFIIEGEVEKQLPFGSQRLLHVIEKVSIPKINHHYTNHYWLEPSNGQVVASEQTPAPGMARIELIVTKPFSGKSE